MPRTAKCLCGAFSVIVSAEPMMVNVRHCQDCQRRSGAPWSSSAYFPKETVHLDGPKMVPIRSIPGRVTPELVSTTILPDLWGNCLLDPRDRLHTVWDPGWGI